MVIRRLGITGSRRGCTTAQRLRLRDVLRATLPDRIWHGGAVGADQWADQIAEAYGIERTIAPGPHGVAFEPAPGARVIGPRPYLSRNKYIVHATDSLLALPNSDSEQQRSGTWATIRYALRRLRHPVAIIWPNGDLVPYRRP